MVGQIRVGRCVYGKNGSRTDPTYDGFTPIVVLTKSSKYGSLSPYVLKNEQGQIMENIWQFSKIYREVPHSKQFYSRWNKEIIWEHQADIHIANRKTTDAYWEWRNKGFNNPHPVRYPVGVNNKGKCVCAIHDGKALTYVDARKQIYLPTYKELVQKEKQFLELKRRIKQGENLLIVDVDGPHQESLHYYKEKYKVDDEFIQQQTMLVTNANIDIMLNDPKHPFGHGYCLAMALLE